MPCCDLIDPLLVEQRACPFERVVNLSNASTDCTGRGPGRDTPEVAGVAEVLGHCRVLRPLAKDGMRENGGHRVSECAFRFTAKARVRSSHFASCCEPGGRETIRSLSDFLEEPEPHQATAHVASSDACSVELDVDPFGVRMFGLMVPQAPSHAIPLPGGEQEILGCERRVEVTARALKGCQQNLLSETDVGLPLRDPAFAHPASSQSAPLVT